MKLNLRNHAAALMFVATIAALPVSQSVMAASQCKGLELKACDASASCSWINSYQTKKGKTISAYCRTKPAKKSSEAPATADKPSTGEKSS